MNNKYRILKLDYHFGETIQTLYPVVLFGSKDVVLIDCGYPSSLALLEEQLIQQHVDPCSLTKLLLTHQDDDHMGAAAELKEKYPAIQILASHIEEPYISGKSKNLRLQQAETLQSLLPDDQKEMGEQFCERYRKLKPVPVDIMLSHGDSFDWAGGCEILLTPGHTPGHLSIRSLENDFLITGDAAALEENKLVIANPDFCLDIKEAEISLHQLQAYDCRRYICCHGGLLEQ